MEIVIWNCCDLQMRPHVDSVSLLTDSRKLLSVNFFCLVNCIVYGDRINEFFKTCKWWVISCRQDVYSDCSIVIFSSHDISVPGIWRSPHKLLMAVDRLC